MNRKIFVLIILLSHAVSATALDMPLKMANGDLHNLEDYRGKWVVVNYWATWCPPCIAEMPDLQAFHNKHSEQNAVVVGINAENIAEDRLEDFLETYFITYPIYVSSLKQSSELGLIPGLPTTFLVSPKGKVEARQVGGGDR